MIDYYIRWGTTLMCMSEHRGAHLHLPPRPDSKAQRFSAHWSPESRCNSLRRHWSESWGGGRGLSLIGRGHFCTSGRPIGGRSRLRYRWVWPDRPLSPHCQWRSFWPSHPLRLLKTQWDGRSLTNCTACVKDMENWWLVMMSFANDREAVGILQPSVEGWCTADLH